MNYFCILCFSKMDVTLSFKNNNKECEIASCSSSLKRELHYTIHSINENGIIGYSEFIFSPPFEIQRNTFDISKFIENEIIIFMGEKRILTKEKVTDEEIINYYNSFNRIRILQ